MAALSGDPNLHWLLASDAGYGFRVQGKDLIANKKGGKAALTLPKGARVLSPCRCRMQTRIGWWQSPLMAACW